MRSQQQVLDDTVNYVRETTIWESTMAALEWDEHTGLPPDAAAYRAEQLTLLSGHVHQRRTNRDFGEWLETLAHSEVATDSESVVGANIRGMLKDFQRSVRLPASLVKRIAYATSVGQHVWAESKRTNDFKKFQPHLDEIIKLRREEAGLLKEQDRTLYDGLLDQYEEDARTEDLVAVFEDLRSHLVPIVQRAASATVKPDPKPLQGFFDIEQQRKFSYWVAKQIGFDFQRGRLDETEHPFCTRLGPHDHRILTKYHADSFASGLFGVLHEAGHGMYEQGLAPEWFGVPAGSPASLGVHESQSRLWENLVGRSRAFWIWCLPHAKKHFSSLKDISVDQIVAALNIVEPSLIRIEADEATYNLHILIRFEIEQDLIDGRLDAAELPHIWAEKYQSYLGVRPADDREGVLQDVHWSAGLIGYFPTYSLGNIFAAQIYRAADRDLGGLDGQIEKGDFLPLLDWMHKHVHQYGRRIPPAALIERATGEAISSKPLIESLAKKVNTYYR